jgi:hypothetical protein
VAEQSSSNVHEKVRQRSFPATNNPPDTRGIMLIRFSQLWSCNMLRLVTLLELDDSYIPDHILVYVLRTAAGLRIPDLWSHYSDIF